jgi:hypothetical protein
MGTLVEDGIGRQPNNDLWVPETSSLSEGVDIYVHVRDAARDDFVGGNGGFMALFLRIGEKPAPVGGGCAWSPGLDSPAEASQAETDPWRSTVLGFAFKNVA